MSALKTQDQGIITLSQQDYLAILIESFLIDRRSQGLSAGTIDFLPKSIIRAGSMPASGLCEVSSIGSKMKRSGRRVKAPRLATEPIELIDVEETDLLLKTGKSN